MNTWKIKGVVRDKYGQTVSKVKVVAVDLDRNGEDLLSTTYTNEQGAYSVTYDEKLFRKTSKERGGPDLQIRIYNDNDELIGETAPKWSASNDEEIDVITWVAKERANHLTIDRFLKKYNENDAQLDFSIGGANLEVQPEKIELEALTEKFKSLGIFSREGLVEMAHNGLKLDEQASNLKIPSMTLAHLINYAVKDLPKEAVDAIRKDAQIERFKGQIDDDDPDYKRFVSDLKLDTIRDVSMIEIDGWTVSPDIFYVYFGSTAAVDLRPYLGKARSQGGRGTCTAFCSTSVVEAMEFFRDQRNPPINLSEELTFWYSKWGQLRTAGGYSGLASLRHYAEYGSCEEEYLPYDGRHFGSNHAHVPVDDIAMDRAQFYRNGEPVTLPARNVEAVKQTLRSGRCVGLACNTHGWSVSTGQVAMPSPLDSQGTGASHCVSIVGFIDRNDLHADLGGGFFIVRNSWGGGDSLIHQLGQEYGGHLLMPYGWYSRYANSAFTLIDAHSEGEEDRNWMVEYYDNMSLQGTPIKKTRAKFDLGIVNVSVDLDVPTEVEEVDFDWGTGSALQYEFPVIVDDESLDLKDNFSIRFSKLKRFREGYYRFTINADDGVRLYVDDQLVLNSWRNQAGTPNLEADHYLTGGDHVLRIEYYENTGNAKIQLQMEAINFNYKVYTNDSILGTPFETFEDSRTDLEWRHVPPVINVMSPGKFSIEGTSQIRFIGGDYRFHSLHSGGCRIWIDEAQVLDDWDGTNPTGNSVAVAHGLRNIKVQYKHSGSIPAIGSGAYYKANVHFGWSQEFWRTKVYHDDDRKTIFDNKFPLPDSNHQAFHVNALTGSPDLVYNYPDADMGPWSFNAVKVDSFLNSIPGGTDMETNWVSVHMVRRIFILEDGYYNAKFEADDGYRLCISGKQQLADIYITGKDPMNKDIFLKAGYHDVTLEYANSKWNGSFAFNLRRVEWNVKYYDGKEFDTFIEEKKLDSIGSVIDSLPDSMVAQTFSVRATRSVWKPVGRYRVQVKADDGVRLKINGVTLIDAWVVQSASSYNHFFEHKGGTLDIEIEYFENEFSNVLEFFMVEEGFLGEYYKGTTLQLPAEGSNLDRNVPIAYRFDPVIDFDWGYGNRLDRVGSSDFSARWNGKIELPVGRYTAQLKADDGVRLFIDGRMIIDQWEAQSERTHTAKIDLTGRSHDVRLEYFEKSGTAVCTLNFVREV